VKLVVPERGSDAARTLFASATQIFSSRLLVTEVTSALARARTLGRLTSRAADSARALSTELLESVVLLEVAPSVADAASRLAWSHRLRAYDAVHLASFERLATKTSVLVAADGDLVRAASAAGHAVAVPGG
jgi:hypothetical protein